MSIQKYIDYTNHVESSPEVVEWISTTLSNYLKKHNPPQAEVEHVIDYLSQNEIKKINQMSYPQAVKKADKWNKKLQKEAEKITELPEDTEVVLDFNDGFKIVQLIGKNAYDREGYLMRHCVASYYGRDIKIYSLRDKNNNPHCTIEWGQQIKGKGNGSINPKYIKYVVKFLERMDMEVGDSEMLNLGYINVEKYKKYLSKKNKLFRNKYWYKEDTLLDVDGDNFYSFDFWALIPIIDKNNKPHKKLKSIIEDSINFLKKNIENNIEGNIYSSRDSAHISSGGSYVQIGSSGPDAHISSSGPDANISSRGSRAHISSGGSYVQIGSSGPDAHISSGGSHVQIGSIGPYAHISSSEGFVQIGSSGLYAHISSSGGSVQIGSIGPYVYIGSSGPRAHISSRGPRADISSRGPRADISSSGPSANINSSGYSSKIDIQGSNGVCANIGRNGKVRGVIGTWITLAEHDYVGNLIFVKSAQIDGKKLKENTWYSLRDKKFVEVK